MNILFITRAYGRNKGGMERLSWELINNLKKQPGIKATILAHSGYRSTAPLYVFTVIPHALRSARYADIIHLGDPMLSIIGWLIKRITHKPVIITVHGLDISYSNPLYQYYLKLFFSKLDLYLPISRHVNTLLEQFKIAGTQLVINPSINPDNWPSTSPSKKKIRETSTNRNIILFTSGRLVKRKGHAWFIANVLPHLPDYVNYHIAGSGPEQKNIITAAKNNNISHRVKLLGQVSEGKLKNLYTSADAFIQPNIKVKHDVEGFGLVLLEAALHSCPVFAAKIDGIPDAIQNQENGFLIKSSDPQAWIKELKAFINKPQPYQSIASQARAYTINKFSWAKIAPQYTQAFLKLKFTTPHPGHTAVRK